MKRIFSFIIMLAIFFFIAAWMFHCNSFAVDKTNRYRPLANGWVSYYAGMFLQKEGDVLKKVRTAVSDDLVHGRFRPAFTLYATIPYALSPIVHHRSSAAEGRPYDKLANGDLRLFSCILLGSVAASLVFMSLLIYCFTGEMLFSLIPALFVPLSPSLTENLLQNYIDSQEIPLILWLSIWIFFFFLAVKTQNSRLRAGFLLLSSAFMILSFLTKETAVVISVALVAVTIMRWLFGFKKESGAASFIIASATSAVCAIAVYLIVSKNNNGYAASYSLLNIADAAKVLKTLWLCLSKYSLNTFYGYIPIVAFLGLALKERHERLNGLPMHQHLLLLVFLLLLCCGFSLIMAPWQPILIKYIFPSVFFLSCAVALSLSLLAAWAKERHGKKGNLFYIVLLIYAVPYNAYYASAQWERDCWADQANYGVAAADQLAASISRTINRNHEKNQAVFVEYGADVEWAAAPVPWAELHLMRILNLDKGINLVDSNGANILNYQMPKAELSSFRKYASGRTLYLSNKRKDLAARRFDAVYKGDKMTETPAPELTAASIGICYRRTNKHIDWQGSSGAFPGFSLYKYLPADCQNKETTEKEQDGQP